jgi:hypothetical protein
MSKNPQGAKGWTCGCGTLQPARVLFCARCGKGPK